MGGRVLKFDGAQPSRVAAMTLEYRSDDGEQLVFWNERDGTWSLYLKNGETETKVASLPDKLAVNALASHIVLLLRKATGAP